ncbi:MAG TPA: PA2779 family protein [Gammaproteobacteria bacterium]|nr:PA2779 family protein [Gammaproteobacteria bacterium]
MSARPIAFVTMFCFLAALLAPAHAGVISTQEYVAAEQAAADRALVTQLLQREDVRERMLGMGVDAADVDRRVAALSDAEVAELADRMESLPAGAGVLETLLIVALVFVILDITGVTDVYPFIDEVE